MSSEPQESTPATPEEEPVNLASQQEVDARQAALGKAASADPERRKLRALMVPMPRSVRQEKLREAGLLQ